MTQDINLIALTDQQVARRNGV